MQKPFSTQRALFVPAAELDHPALHALDDAETLLDRSAFEGLLSPIYGSRTGRPSYPLQTLFRSLPIGAWYGLSDVQLSRCLCRDLLFRRFCRLELDGGVPDATTLGRFRSRLVDHELWDRLLQEVNRQLEAHGIVMAHGRIDIIDATPVEAARSGRGKGKDGERVRDPEADFHVKRDSRGRRKITYGYSVHVGVDEDGFVHRQTVTAGNVHDSRARDRLLLGDETALYADSAYSSRETRETLARMGIADCVQRKGYRNRPLSAADKERNAEIAVVRSGVERVFGIYKRCYGLGRTRFLGLAKNLTFYGLAAIALNIRKGARFLRLYGVREAVVEG